MSNRKVLDIKVVTARTLAGDTNSATVMAANARRVYACICNASDVAISLGFGAAAVSGTGVVIPAGGRYELIQGVNMYLGLITAIAASGSGKTVASIEGQ